MKLLYHLKLAVALIALHLICMHSDYYMVDATAYDGIWFTEYVTESGDVFTSYDHDSGSGVLIMDGKGTIDLHDDEFLAFVGK